MRSEFIFHQALFGYDTGHHLIGASLELPTDARHLLAVATDLSGSPSPEGFDAAYTGLPLAGTNFYALFCTWLAPEMRRPGCVWSHVLLIPLADLAELPDLGQLRRVFHRPDSTHWGGYRAEVRFRVEGEASSLSPSMMGDAEKMLMGLYLAPKRSAVFPASNAQRTEDLIFALWSQQWPRLRRNFRFSSGSFADRGRGTTTAFDLQVSPEASRRAWQRGGDYLLLDSAAARDPVRAAEAQPWISAALDDLVAPNSRELRSFLREFGADVNDPRSAFEALALAFERVVIRPSSDWAETLESIGEMFSDPSDACRLKELLISPRDLPTSEQDLDRNLAIVAFLLATDRSKPYRKVSPDFAGLARRLWPGRRTEVLALLAQLVRQQEYPSAINFAAAVAEAVQPSELGLILEQRPELIPLFLGHRPTLASHVGTWQLPTNSQWRIYEVLEGLSLGAKQWGEILTAMIIAATDVAVRNVVERAGPCAIDSAFRWLDHASAQEKLPSQLWREALAEPAANRVQEAELSPPTLALCAWLLEPEVARELLSASRNDVQQLSRQPIEALPLPLRLHTAFLLVAVGLRAPAVDGARLIGRGFFPVHDALASNSYSQASWQLLSPELPKLSFWKEWDRCEKLQRAVRRRMSQHMGIMAKMLHEAATSPEHHEVVRRIEAGFSLADNDLDVRLL